MRHTVLLLTCLFLFAKCPADKRNFHVSSYDTLGIHWAIIEHENIIYCFQDFKTQSAYATRYIGAHDSAYKVLSLLFNPKLPHKLRFFIWSDTLRATLILRSPLGFADVQNCICHVKPNQSRGHEMTHVLSYWSNGKPPIAITQFVNEGTAVAFNLNQMDKIALAKVALTGQRIYSIKGVWAGGYYIPTATFYPLAGAFMQFLYQHSRPTQFNALLKNQTLKNAEIIYGQSHLDSLFANFDALIGLR